MNPPLKLQIPSIVIVSPNHSRKIQFTQKVHIKTNSCFLTEPMMAGSFHGHAVTIAPTRPPDFLDHNLAQVHLGSDSSSPPPKVL